MPSSPRCHQVLALSALVCSGACAGWLWHKFTIPNRRSDQTKEVGALASNTKTGPAIPEALRSPIDSHSTNAQVLVTVTDKTRRPLVGAQVQEYFGGVLVDERICGSNGTALLEITPAATMPHLRVVMEGYFTAEVPDHDPRWKAATETRELFVTMSASQTARVRVVDSRGEAVRGAQLSIRQIDDHIQLSEKAFRLVSSVSDEFGLAQMHLPVAKQEITIIANCVGYGEATTRVNAAEYNGTIEITLLRYAVAGVVFLGGAPANSTKYKNTSLADHTGLKSTMLEPPQESVRLTEGTLTQEALCDGVPRENVRWFWALETGTPQFPVNHQIEVAVTPGSPAQMYTLRYFPLLSASRQCLTMVRIDFPSRAVLSVAFDGPEGAWVVKSIGDDPFVYMPSELPQANRPNPLTESNSYNFELPPGSYVIGGRESFLHPPTFAPIELTLGPGEHRRVTISPQQDPGGTLKIKVQDKDGNPIESGWISVTGAIEALMFETCKEVSDIGVRLLAREYTVRVMASGWTVEGGEVQTVTVLPAETAELVFELVPNS